MQTGRRTYFYEASTMANVFTLKGANGDDVGSTQPIANSVTGSPFTSGAAAAVTPSMTGLMMIYVLTNPVHVRFDKPEDTADADANDWLLGVGNHVIPCNDHVMSFIQETAAGTIYIEKAREILT